MRHAPIAIGHNTLASPAVCTTNAPNAVDCIGPNVYWCRGFSGGRFCSGMRSLVFLRQGDGQRVRPPRLLLNMSPLPTVTATCYRPLWWCMGNGYAEYDCNGDGIPDHTCHDAGNRGTLLSGECNEVWPQADPASCAPVFGTWMASMRSPWQWARR
jgi:hypothetical protein